MVRDATPADKTRIIDLLSAAFDGNPSVNFIVRQDARRLRRIRALMDYSLALCSRFGCVLVTDDLQACALVLFPRKKKADWKTLLLDLGLVLRCTGLRGAFRAARREALVGKQHPEGDFAYLWFIGVEPAAQGRGAGSALLQALRLRCGGRPICLETSVKSNADWYCRHGFVLYHHADAGCPLYFLRVMAV